MEADDEILESLFTLGTQNVDPGGETKVVKGLARFVTNLYCPKSPKDVNDLSQL